ADFPQAGAGMNTDQAGVLKVSGLSSGYRGTIVIRDLSLPALQPGQVYSLLGPNAAGKSTLLRALAGLLPAQGSICLGAQELLQLNLARRAQLVTYMPQAIPEGIGLSVLESVLGALRASPLDHAPAQDEVQQAIA